MRITVESTQVVVGIQAIAARRWEGVTEGGIPVVALITRISPQTHDAAALAQFEAEFQEVAPPNLAAEPIHSGAGGAAEVDRGRVERLAEQILRVLRPELARPPLHPDNVWVALNALAYATATILAGAANGNEGLRAWIFFDRAVTENLFAMLPAEDGG